jgi:plastocyanin
MMNCLVLGLFVISSDEGIVQPSFAASAAEVTAVDLTRGRNAWNAASDLVRVQIAATMKDVGGAKVSIANFAFVPADITIAPGETVTWINNDGAPHGLKYPDGAIGTDLLLPGATFSRRFDQPGTYTYNCSVHPYMTGRVIVGNRRSSRSME